MYKIGQKVIITDGHNHGFKVGSIYEIRRTDGDFFMLTDSRKYLVQHLKIHQFKALENEIEALKEETPIDISKLKPIIEMATTAQKNAVLITALELLRASNKITPEQVIEKLRKDEKEYRWTLTVVKEHMETFVSKGFIVNVKGSYISPNTTFGKSSASVKTATSKAVKTISKVAKPASGKITKISKTTALDLIKNTKGRFFTAVFTKKDGTLRTINCQYRKGQPTSEFGYVQVSESGLLKKSPTTAIRQINMQTLRGLTIAGNKYSLSK